MMCDEWTPELLSFLEDLPRVHRHGAVVVYTAVVSGYDVLAPPPEGCLDVSYVCFSSSEELCAPGWEIVKIPRLYRDPRRTARVYKMMPHLLFPNAAISLWVDGSCIIKGSPKELADKYFADLSVQFVCFAHPVRQRVEDEKNACLHGRKDDLALIQEQVECYFKIGFPDRDRLVASGVLLRRSLVPEVVAFNESWLREVDKYTSRDQLSFNFVAWQRGFQYHLFQMNQWRNEFCEWKPHSRFVFYNRKAKRIFSLRINFDFVRGKFSYAVRRFIDRVKRVLF